MSNWEYIKIGLSTFLTTVIILAIIFGMIIGLTSLSTHNACVELVNLNSSYQFHWDFWNGCLVQTPSGYWVSIDKYLPLEINTNKDK